MNVRLNIIPDGNDGGFGSKRDGEAVGTAPRIGTVPRKGTVLRNGTVLRIGSGGAANAVAAL